MAASPEPWAKANGETLVNHTLNVIQRISQLRDRAPFLTDLAGDQRLWHRLALAAAVHDLGKADPRFQFMLRQPRGTEPSYGHRHEVLSLAWLDWLLGHDDHHDARPIAAAVASHHRDHEFIKTRYCLGTPWQPLPNIPHFVHPIPAETFAQVAQLLLEQILPEVLRTGLLQNDWAPPPPWEFSPDDHSRAIQSISHHLKSWQLWIDEMTEEPAPSQSRICGFLLRGAIMLADHAASAHQNFHKLTLLTRPGELRSHLAPRTGNYWYPHQQQAAQTVGHAILIAPTGSGKTEAALLWAANQYETRGGHAPLFYVLPYKASMNAMRLRLVDAVACDTGNSKHRDELVTLQHSSAVAVLYHQLTSEQPDQSPKQAERFAKHQANLARLHTTPVRVLSPYQLLRAAYQLKGHEAIWADAAGGTFIIDEIHAYEPQRVARILEMLRFLIDHLGARVLVMTATMPRPVLDRLTGILGNPPTIVADQTTFDQFRRHHLVLRSDGLLSPSTVNEIVARTRSGASVLCVATTVSRAQQLHAQLTARLDDQSNVHLLHSRFTAGDRSHKEKQLHELVSTKLRGNRHKQVVLVATQVVEVSLDVDFDVLFSDPAPLEALVQRFGRVNRSRRSPPHDVVVCTPLEDSQPVYCQRLVSAALDRLQHADGTVIDERDIQQWLDTVYDGSIGSNLRSVLQEQSREFQRTVVASMIPFDTNGELENMFYKQFDGTEVLPASLVDRYRAALEAEPLRACSLTVPISFKQLDLLLRKQLVDRPAVHGLPTHAPCVVKVHYDSALGLNLSTPCTMDDT